MNLCSRKLFVLIPIIILLLITAGCGGGDSSSQPTARKSSTTVKTSGLVTSGMLVGALEIVVSFPYGVMPAIDPTTNEPARSVARLIGTADPGMTLSALQYTAPTPTSPGSLRVVYLNAAGFTPSDAILIELIVATGYFPTTADFNLTKFEVTAMSADGKTIYAPAAVQNPTMTVEIL